MSKIHHSNVAKLFIPFGLLFGAVVPYKGKDKAVDVHYISRANNNLYWDRVFKFQHSDFHFKSYMESIEQGEVIEFVRYGIGIRLNVSAEEGVLVFRDIGYLWRIFGFDIPIPGSWLMGQVYVAERPIDGCFFL